MLANPVASLNGELAHIERQSSTTCGVKRFELISDRRGGASWPPAVPGTSPSCAGKIALSQTRQNLWHVGLRLGKIRNPVAGPDHSGLACVVCRECEFCVPIDNVQQR